MVYHFLYDAHFENFLVSFSLSPLVFSSEDPCLHYNFLKRGPSFTCNIIHHEQSTDLIIWNITLLWICYFQENDTPELAVAKLFASAKRNGAQFSGYGALTQCLQQLPPEGQIRVFHDSLPTLLYFYLQLSLQ